MRYSGGKDLVTDDNSGGYYVCECENCGHVFSSEHANGGGSIADTGDYNEIRCPQCDDIEPPQCENVEKVWNIQQLKINHLVAALKLAETWLSGWASAENELSIIRAAIARVETKSSSPDL